MIAPMIAGLVAALFNIFHQKTSSEVELEQDREYKKKLEESRSIDKIDVEDTRSKQSSIVSE